MKNFLASRDLQAVFHIVGEALGRGDVHLGQLVAGAAAARVQDDPDPAPFVDAQLEEVVARAERAELLGGTCGLLVGQLGDRTVIGQPAVRR